MALTNLVTRNLLSVRVADGVATGMTGKGNGLAHRGASPAYCMSRCLWQRGRLADQPELIADVRPLLPERRYHAKRAGRLVGSVGPRSFPGTVLPRLLGIPFPAVPQGF